ncbi:MAG: hypothetical protein AABM29_06575 [Actinomycetota bacterium]
MGLVVAASGLLTAFHFTDNYLSIETYPQPDWVTGAAVLVSWPLFTALGVAGYLLYRQGRFATAHGFLIAYSYTGLSSLGHFLSGSPDEFTTRGLISVLTDGVAGSAVLAVALWSILARRVQPAPPGRSRIEHA